MISVREATSDDSAAIYLLNKNGLGYDFDPDKTKDRLNSILQRQRDMIFVAEADGEVIGYIHSADYECTYFEPLKNILSLVVEEERRGLGVGRMLLAAVERRALESGAAGVRLVSGFNRQDAHKFSLACGYIVRKDQKNFIKLF